MPILEFQRPDKVTMIESDDTERILRIPST